MATQQDIETAVNGINEVWTNPNSRRARFGNSLRQVAITDIRGISATIEFPWPVCAIAGTNGAGKTTVLQLCSAAYTRPDSGQRHYSIGRWIGPAVGAEGEAPPFGVEARVNYQFWDDTPTLAVPYQEERSRWGYPRRGNPSRNVSFVGIANFAPRIERVDRTHQNRSRLQIRGTTTISPEIVRSISRTIGQQFSAAEIHTVSTAGAEWTDLIPALRRGEIGYTEAHMGAGEQKLVRLISFLEQVPDRSLLLLEEPELMLHADAQVGLAWYLMTLARRKGHQILIATHSAPIFETLPRIARILLARSAVGTQCVQGAPKLAAARMLSATSRANREIILVEDLVAKAFLEEIIDRHSPDLRANASVVPIGSDDDVRRVTGAFRQSGCRVVGVRDPDIGGDGVGLFSLPGNVCPEALLVAPANILRAESLLGGVAEAYERALGHVVGFEGSSRAKRLLSALAAEATRDPEVISDRLTLAWLSDPGNNDAAIALVASIRASLDTLGE